MTSRPTPHPALPSRHRKVKLRPLLLLALALIAAPLAGCNDAAELPEWTPADHDGNTQGAPRGAQTSGKLAPGEDESATLVAVTWRQNCARCHGMSGRADTAEGRMLRSPDLTRASFQDRASDAEIANVIRKGRNKMPEFNLPPNVIDGLVKHIRSLRK